MTSQADRDKSRALRIAAELAGAIKFESAIPCQCGNSIKYVSSGDCVDCTITKAEESRRRAPLREQLRNLESGHVIWKDGSTVKRCPKCEEIKDTTMFYVDPSKVHGCSSWCIKCRRESALQRYNLSCKN